MNKTVKPMDRIDHYDYELPEELIAQVPTPQRAESRLMVIDRQAGEIAHLHFFDLPKLLGSNDLLVMNNTQVVPARLTGRRQSTGGKWEGLFLRDVDPDHWRVIGQTRGRLQMGEKLELLSTNNTTLPPLLLSLVEKCDGGEWIARPHSSQGTLALLQSYGDIPLPHYMRRAATSFDHQRYQTTYASRPGAVAAPTAGLHFTPEVLQACRTQGVDKAMVTLHVGLGTFRPVKATHLSDHQMHSEWCELTQETVAAIQACRSAHGRVIAVGTTTVRTLEAAAARGELAAWQGETDLFIRPPFEFQVVDGLITNFHLPKSTLLVLVSTFAGRELMLHAYQEAVRLKYRFFSYGDAMLIL